LDGTRSLAGGRDEFLLELRLPNGTLVAPAQNLTVPLSIHDAQPAQIVPGFYLTSSDPATVNSVTFASGSSDGRRIYVGQPQAIGSYRVRTALSGENFDSDPQSVLDLRLRMNQSSFVLGNGLVANTLRVERTNGNTPFAHSTRAIVGINVVDTTFIGAPPQVIIPANQTSVTVPLTGRQVSTGPVNLSAFSVPEAFGPSGFIYAPSPAIPVSVVEPSIVFTGLTPPQIQSTRNAFKLRYFVANSSEPNQISPIDNTVNLDIANAQPANIVAGIYDSSVGGNLVNSVVFQGNMIETPTRYAGAATAAGNYQIRAAIPARAGSPWLSPVQTASTQSNVLSFNNPGSVTNVGKDLYRVLELRLQNAPVSPIAITLSSNPPGALEFDPATVTLSGVSAPVKIIGRAIANAEAIATGPAGFGTANLPLEVVPAFPERMEHSVLNDRHSVEMPGQTLAATPLSVSVQATPENSVTTQNCALEIPADAPRVSCNTQAIPDVFASFVIRFDAGTLGAIDSDVLHTHFIFPPPDAPLLEFTQGGGDSFYLYQCFPDDAVFTVSPSAVASVKTTFVSGPECLISISALSPGDATLTMSLPFGSRSKQIRVVPSSAGGSGAKSARSGAPKNGSATIGGEQP
jgi:hypothetical protein